MAAFQPTNGAGNMFARAGVAASLGPFHQPGGPLDDHTGPFPPPPPKIRIPDDFQPPEPEPEPEPGPRPVPPGGGGVPPPPPPPAPKPGPEWLAWVDRVAPPGTPLKDKIKWQRQIKMWLETKRFLRAISVDESKAGRVPQLCEYYSWTIDGGPRYDKPK